MACDLPLCATQHQTWWATVAVLRATMKVVGTTTTVWDGQPYQGLHCSNKAGGATMEYCTRCANGALCATMWLRQTKGSVQLLSSGAINNGVWCATTEYCVVCQYCVSQHLNLLSSNQWAIAVDTALPMLQAAWLPVNPD